MPSLRERADRRDRAIERFCERQRVTRHWISFAELVDWCASITTTAGVAKYDKAWDLALSSLAVSIPNGEFEGKQRRGNDGSKVLYLAPYTPGAGAPPRCRLTREALNFVYEAAPPLPPIMLTQLWVTRDLARRWLESHNYSFPPFLDESRGSTTPARPLGGLGKLPSSDTPPSRDDLGEPPLGESLTQPEEITITLEGNIGFENRTVPPFVVGSAHTVFEWCMVYTDRHPAGLHPNHNGASFRDMRTRLTLLGATGGEQRDAYGEPMGARNDPEWQIMNEVYRELARDIERDRIRPLRPTFCDDAADEFDPTRCRIDIEPVLAIARRRGDFGQTVVKLLAVHGGGSAVEPTIAAYDAHSGFPGRPSKSKHLVDDEFDRRIAIGEALPSLAHEARALLVWLKENHRNAARPTLKTIEENIRARHRQWKASRPHPDDT